MRSLTQKTASGGGPLGQQPARGFLPAVIVGVAGARDEPQSMPRAAAKAAKARSRAARLGLGFAMLITAKRARAGRAQRLECLPRAAPVVAADAVDVRFPRG